MDSRSFIHKGDTTMARKKLKVATEAAEDARTGQYIVKLDDPHCKAAVVEADSNLEAIEKYKEVMGIRSSIHEFRAEFLENGADHLELDENGIVIKEFAQENAEDES